MATEPAAATAELVALGGLSVVAAACRQDGAVVWDPPTLPWFIPWGRGGAWRCSLRPNASLHPSLYPPCLHPQSPASKTCSSRKAFSSCMQRGEQERAEEGQCPEVQFPAAPAPRCLIHASPSLPCPQLHPCNGPLEDVEIKGRGDQFTQHHAVRNQNSKDPTQLSASRPQHTVSSAVTRSEILTTTSRGRAETSTCTS